MVKFPNVLPQSKHRLLNSGMRKMNTPVIAGGLDPGPPIDQGAHRYWDFQIYEQNGGANLAISEMEAYAVAGVETDLLAAATITADNTDAGSVANLTDGNTTDANFWQNNIDTNGAPQRIKVDLGVGNDANLNQFKIWGRSATMSTAPTIIFIRYSDDDVNYTIKGVWAQQWLSDVSPKVLTVYSSSITQYQFFRLRIFSNNGGANMRLHGLTIVSDGNDIIPPDGRIACDVPATGLGAIEDLIDGDNGTYYECAAGSLTATFYMDADQAVDFQTLALARFKLKGPPTTNESPQEIEFSGLRDDGDWDLLVFGSSLSWSPNEEKDFAATQPADPDYVGGRSWAMYESNGATQTAGNNTNTPLDTNWTSSSKGGSADFLPGTENNGEFIVPSGVDTVSLGVDSSDNVAYGNTFRLGFLNDGAGLFHMDANSNTVWPAFTHGVGFTGVAPADVLESYVYHVEGANRTIGASDDMFIIVDRTGELA